MLIHNIAGYKFVGLDDLPVLQAAFLEKGQILQLKGTILLSSEGINISLAGLEDGMTGFKSFLKEDPRFADIVFKESLSELQPFRRMKVKLRKEIITMRQPDVNPAEKPAPNISPEELKRWLDENRDITILDTRNDYEVQFGTFHGAVNLHLKDFSEFPEKSRSLSKNKPIVMFCTGGIRCEKAGVHLLNSGHEEVYQLEGGILNYFAAVGGEHYEGECFVFDGRIALDSNLQTTGTDQCRTCQGPIKLAEDHRCITI